MPNPQRPRTPLPQQAANIEPWVQAESRGRSAVRLVVAAAAVQLLWWLVIAPGFTHTELPDGAFIRQAEVAQLAFPDIAEVESADWRTVSLPWSECCHSSYYAVRMDLSGERTEDIGLIPGVGADNYWLYVNGVAVRKEGNLSPSTYHGLSRTVVRIPLSVLKADGNDITLLTARNSLYYTDVFPAFVADYAALKKATRWRQFVLDDLRQINVQIPLMIALVCLCLLMQARNRAFLLALAALALTWGLRNAFYAWETFPFGEFVRRSYYAAVSSALPLAWFAFAHYWAGPSGAIRRWNRVLQAIGLVWLAGVGWAVYTLSNGGLAAIEASERFVEVFGVGATTLAALRMTTHLISSREDRAWEAAVLLLCMTTFAVEMAQYFFQDFGRRTSGHSAALFLLAIVIAIIARNVRLFESMSAFNIELDERLAAKELEIQSTYERLESANREAALGRERQRLLRDVHDGIGAQLTSLLALVRGGRADTHAVEQAIEESVDDLRLIIDSLDTATDRLAIALGAFRARVEPRLTASGLATEWNFDDLPMSLRCEPDQILQIYRILQEAVSNALKHANATALTLTATTTDNPDGYNVEIAVADNGHWQPPTASTVSRGLTSMRQRADALGGELEVITESTGTTVEVRFQIPRHNSAVR